jgi:dUTP pyrophosphatase
MLGINTTCIPLRSSITKHCGEICLILINHGREWFQVNTGDRIAQLVLAPVTRAIPIEVFQLETTARDAGGFGSTKR